MKQLKIQLIGPTGSGKTTVARLLEHFFLQNGFTISGVEDADLKKLDDKNKEPYDLSVCVESLRERVCIKIETAQSNNAVVNWNRTQIDKAVDSAITSWERSPDRMGGQFTQEEIERSRNTW